MTFIIYWQIVTRTKTPQEILEEFERLEREKNERRLQQQTNPKVSFLCMHVLHFIRPHHMQFVHKMHACRYRWNSMVCVCWSHL